MFGFLVPSYSPDTSIKLHSATSQQNKQVTAVSSSDLNHKQTTPSELFTDILTNYSHTQQLDIWIYNLIPIRFWLRYQGLADCHINWDVRFSRWWLWCCSSPWSSHSAGRYVTSERNLPPPSSWWWRRQMLWNVSAYLTDCTVPLRIFLVSVQLGVHKTNSNNLHIYTLIKLHLIQSIRVINYAEGWDTSTWEFRIWSPCPVRML